MQSAIAVQQASVEAHAQSHCERPPQALIAPQGDQMSAGPCRDFFKRDLVAHASTPSRFLDWLVFWLFGFEASSTAFWSSLALSL